MPKAVSDNDCLRRTSEIKETLKQVTNKLDTLLTNHLPHLGTDVAILKNDLTDLKEDVRLLKKIAYTKQGLSKKEYSIITALIGIITTVVSFLVK